MALLSADALVRTDETGSPIFEPVTFDLEPGDRLALRGPSGIGKTLVLRSLTLLDDSDEGAVRFNGEAVASADIPAFRREVLLLAQSSPMTVGTVAEGFELALGFSNKTLDDDRASTLLGRFELEALMFRSTSELSGGERQAVALVRALLLEPQVLLLDEPTSAMDPERCAVAELLIDEWLAAGERACVWVSHDAAQLERVTARSVVMKRPAAKDDIA